MASLRAHFLPVSLLSYLAVLTAVEAEPIAATWSSGTFGPDGPWQAVEVNVGGSQTISMYPGSEWTSVILTSDYCTYNRTISCEATKAGLYNKEQSELGGSGSSALIAWQPGKDFMSGVNVAGEDLTMWVDNMEVGGQTVSNVSMALLGENFAEYPDGSLVPLSVSCLGLGAPKNVNQTFTIPNADAVNASLIPGYLWSEGTTASNSFGMHIGSADPHMAGSLYFGGYDQNRVVGDILTGSGGIHSAIDLKDISITVEDGESPWEFESMGGLLAEGNSSISQGGIEVSVDGCSPYLTLPKSTCDAIAAHLPVKYNEKLGLYTWKTKDSKYSQIVPSASALQFTFLSGSNTDNITISVPFMHLNLTLDSPLVDEPTQYFPCFTGADKYALGRAFLQDAFIGANWGADTWWLAQAPGPNVPSADVAELADDDTELKASANDWKESWSGSWTALTAEDVSSTSISSTPDSTDTSDADNTAQGGAASGTAIGIGVGVGVGAVAIIGGLGFFFIRRRRTAAKLASAESSDSPPDGTAGAMNMNMNMTSAPYQGWYQPVKQNDGSVVATSPGMTVPIVYSPGQQPQDQQQQQQYYYAQELTAVGNTPMELPGSNPQPHEAHLIGIHPSQQQQPPYPQQPQ